MICNNCGKNNKNNAKFCSNCGSILIKEKSPNNKNFKSLIIAIISLIFIIAGYFVLKSTMFNDISITDVVIDKDYKVEKDAYIFDLNDKVIGITPRLDSNRKIELKGTVDNSNIATCYKTDDTFYLVPKKIGKSKLTIYSDNDKILYVVEFEFRDGLDKDDDESKQYQNKSSANKPSQYDNQDEYSSVPTQEIESLMTNYLTGYQQAANTGDFSFVSDYMYEGSPEYEDTRKAILSTYEKGTQLYLYDFKINNIEKISDEKYKVSCIVEWDITNNEGERLQKESADYIVYNFNNSYMVYSMKNWQLISKQYM